MHLIFNTEANQIKILVDFNLFSLKVRKQWMDDVLDDTIDVAKNSLEEFTS
jgi:hypothetical protein